MRAVSPGRRRRDGIASHDLAYIPIYAEHVQCGKVDGKAMPVIETPTASMIRIDAATGFTHPAIDAGFEKLIPLARTNGITGMSIHNSCNCGVLGYHTERLAEVGLVGIGFTNAPASIAPSGRYRGVSFALMTEVMAAALAGAKLGSRANPFAGTAGGPPRTGQFFIAINPATIEKIEGIIRLSSRIVCMDVRWRLRGKPGVRRSPVQAAGTIAGSCRDIWSRRLGSAARNPSTGCVGC